MELDPFQDPIVKRIHGKTPLWLNDVGCVLCLDDGRPIYYVARLDGFKDKYWCVLQIF